MVCAGVGADPVCVLGGPKAPMEGPGHKSYPQFLAMDEEEEDAKEDEEDKQGTEVEEKDEPY